MKITRRQFAELLSAAAASTAVAPLGLFHARRAAAASCPATNFVTEGFGPIRPTVPLNTEMLRAVDGYGDLSGYALLELPAHFQYTAVSVQGAVMSDGVPVPGSHDGMACFQGQKGYTLVRNHERSIGSAIGCLAPNGKQYDPFTGTAAGTGGGGTTTLVIGRDGLLVEDFVSLGGTIRNCAGGPTPWGSWISCEENMTTPASDARATRRHGYNFEVPSSLGEAVDPIPLIEMGRMNHEAVSADPRDGYIYQTEDRGDSCYYRFVPHKKPNKFGILQEGGTLYALVIEPGQQGCDSSYLPTVIVDGQEVVDTRGLRRGAPGSMQAFLGKPLNVRWVELEDVDPEADTLRLEAQAKGAARFHRGEGAWYADGKHYFVCSGGGDEGEGQVFCFDPKAETITLIVESTDDDMLDGPDNITVAPDGTIYLCEDGSSGSPGEANYSQRIVGVSADGGLFNFARNNLGTAEFAGACFSQDSRFLFVNVQGHGITYAISRDDNRPILLHPFGA